MNYDLAFKLKEAGFPQKEIKPWPFPGTDGLEEALWNRAYQPTLSEIINSCGDKLRFIENGDEWTAGGHSARGYGDTIEEAVAELWILLNK